MARTFAQRVQTAAHAGWCTIIIAAVWLTFAWLAFLGIQCYRPGWILALWGGVTWDQVRWIVMIFMAVAKLILFTLLMVTIWLTIWGRKLKKLGDS